MQPDQSLRQAFTVADQAAEARHPCEAAFDDPAARQQHEAMLGRGQLDDLQTDAVCLHIRRRPVASIALVNECDLDRFVRHFLDLSGQLTDLCPVLFVGRSDDNRQQVTQCIDRQVYLPALRRLCPS